MSNKVTKNDANKDSSTNKGLIDQNCIKEIIDRGDNAKQDLKLDDLNNKQKVKSVDEKQKIIDDFIKQYLPDRGDSKRFTYKTNRNVRNYKTKNCDVLLPFDTEKSNHKVAERESEKDVLIIPETGEKLCKTDNKLSYSNSTKRNEMLNDRPDKNGINEIISNRLKKATQSTMQRKEQRGIKTVHCTFNGNDDPFNEKSFKDVKDSQKKNNEEKQKGKHVEINEQIPITVTSKFMDQILKQTGVNPDFRARNEGLHAKGPYVNNSERNGRHSNFLLKEYIKPSKGSKLDDVRQRIRDQFEYNKYRNGIRTENDKEKIQRNPEERKKIRARYTLKLNNIEKEDKEFSDKINLNKATQQNEKIAKPEEINRNISNTEPRKFENAKAITEPKVRKPIIKTIMPNNDRTRIYKAVTFIDQKRVTPLQINIPVGKRKFSKIINTTMKTRIKVSKTSLKEKTSTSRRRADCCKRRKFKPSPDTSVVGGKISPPTEVAKWAPSCINEHTKPYYEAWVNTTLAATARDDDNDELLLEKQRIIRSFKRALEERPKSPELVYENFLDEKYTGKIKVRQK